jgi:hypothetical protein
MTTNPHASYGREGALQADKPSASDWTFFGDTAGQMAEAARMVGDAKLAGQCQLLQEAMRRHETLTRTPWLKFPDPIATDELSQFFTLLVAVTDTAKRYKDFELFDALKAIGGIVENRVSLARRR